MITYYMVRQWRSPGLDDSGVGALSHELSLFVYLILLETCLSNLSIYDLGAGL